MIICGIDHEEAWREPPTMTKTSPSKMVRRRPKGWPMNMYMVDDTQHASVYEDATWLAISISLTECQGLHDDAGVPQELVLQ